MGQLQCLGRECGRDISGLVTLNATSRCRGDTSFGGRNCNATCARGFKPRPGSPSQV